MNIYIYIYIINFYIDVIKEIEIIWYMATWETRFLTLTVYHVKYWFTKIKVSKYFFPNNLENFLEVRKIVHNPFLTIYSHVFMEHAKDI